MAKKILIIDDDRTNVKLVQNRLEKEGFFVVTAFDGDVGLQKVRTSPPDMIILDVEMPEVNGYTFLLELQKMNQLSKLPIIILTSHAELEPIFKFNRVKGYIIKPVNFDTLLKLMNETLAEQ